MTTEDKNKRLVSVYLDEAIIEMIQERARQEGRSVSGMAAVLIGRGLESPVVSIPHLGKVK